MLFAYCAHGIHPGFGVVSMEADAPHIQRTQITSELQNCGSTLGRNHPVGCFELLQEAVLYNQSDATFASNQWSIMGGEAPPLWGHETTTSYNPVVA